MGQVSCAQFQIGDNVVYPSHGIGQITGEEVQNICGTDVKLYVISFSRDKMTLRIPKSNAKKTGLRHLCSESELKDAIEVLKSKAQFKKSAWNKRSQEYETKINSGSVTAIAEVLRDLHPNADFQDRSYSEKAIYEMALERLSHEYAVTQHILAPEARQKILSILSYFKD